MNQMSTLINTALVRAMDAINSLRARLAEERGQDLIEYAMLGGLIALAIIAVGVLAFSGAINDMATGIGNCIDFDSSAASPCDPF
jgi:Flp pilus assembly pilin Flp